MNYKLKAVYKETGIEVTDGDMLLALADVDGGCKFESVGIQSNGTPVVFDKCGNFGYLDYQNFEVIICLST